MFQCSPALPYWQYDTSETSAERPDLHEICQVHFFKELLERLTIATTIQAVKKPGEYT